LEGALSSSIGDAVDIRTAPRRNPFPVYPVVPLQEVSSIRSVTVFTKDICRVADAIADYLKDLGRKRSDKDPPAKPLIMRVQGDYGTGKTHLLLFAHSELREALPARKGLRPTELGPPISMLVRGKEYGFADWFVAEFRPEIAKLASSHPASGSLRILAAELLALAAIEVAAEASLTAELSEKIRSDPNEVYEILRTGRLSNTAVERKYKQSIAEIAGDSSAELCDVLSLLAWDKYESAAIRWLSGMALSGSERQLLRIDRDLDIETEGIDVIAAIAGLCTHVGRPFALLLDELEHLANFDAKSESRRNATDIKRLIERLGYQSAFVGVAGHWSAWRQLQDFHDRFQGLLPLTLVRLNYEDVKRIADELAQSVAPSWANRATEEAWHSIAESSDGNIRRAMSVLYQLFGDTIDRDDPITRLDAERAAEKRLVLTASSQELDTKIEEIATQKGGQTKRAVSLGLPNTQDIVIHRGGTPRLIAEVRHAQSPDQLIVEGESFAASVSALQHDYPGLEGLLVVSGAVQPQLASLLSELPGINVVSADAPDAAEMIEKRIGVALSAEARPIERDPEAILAVHSRVDTARDEASKARRASLAALEAVPASDLRGQVVKDIAQNALQNEPGVDAGVARQKLARAVVPSKQQVWTFTVRRLPFQMAIVALLVSIAVAVLDVRGFASGLSVPLDQLIGIHLDTGDIRAIVLAFCCICLAVSVATLLTITGMEVAARRRFLRWALLLSDELVIRSFPEDVLLHTRSVLENAPYEAVGYGDAIGWALRRLPDQFDFTRKYLDASAVSNDGRGGG
jgi:hypothetical protein